MHKAKFLGKFLKTDKVLQYIQTYPLVHFLQLKEAWGEYIFDTIFQVGFINPMEELELDPSECHAHFLRHCIFIQSNHFMNRLKVVEINFQRVRW